MSNDVFDDLVRDVEECCKTLTDDEDSIQELHNRRHMSDTVPFIPAQKPVQVKEEIAGVSQCQLLLMRLPGLERP